MTCTIIGIVVTCIVTVNSTSPNINKAFQIFIQSAHPIISIPVYPPVIRETISTNVKNASLTPWDFPTPAPRTRLDGSLLTDQPAIYGYPSINIYPLYRYALPCFYTIPIQVHRHEEPVGLFKLKPTKSSKISTVFLR